jgi:hypothetical protein
MGMSAAERQRRHRRKKYAALAELPKIECACGCRTLIPPVNKKGENARFLHGHNPSSTQFKPGHKWDAETAARTVEGRRRPGSTWYTGRYVRVTLHPDEVEAHPTALHHRSTNHWSIPRSHVVWNEHHPDDKVQPGEHVHHINHVRDDDYHENLLKLSAAEHPFAPRPPA